MRRVDQPPEPGCLWGQASEMGAILLGDLDPRQHTCLSYLLREFVVA